MSFKLSDHPELEHIVKQFETMENNIITLTERVKSLEFQLSNRIAMEDKTAPVKRKTVAKKTDSVTVTSSVVEGSEENSIVEVPVTQPLTAAKAVDISNGLKTSTTVNIILKRAVEHSVDCFRTLLSSVTTASGELVFDVDKSLPEMLKDNKTTLSTVGLSSKSDADLASVKFEQLNLEDKKLVAEKAYTKLIKPNKTYQDKLKAARNSFLGV